MFDTASQTIDISWRNWKEIASYTFTEGFALLKEIKYELKCLNFNMKN